VLDLQILQYKPAALKVMIAIHSMVESEIGVTLFQVTGNVTNPGNVTAQSVYAIATFYGTAGMLLILTLQSHPLNNISWSVC
jgi:hypothetical protein